VAEVPGAGCFTRARLAEAAGSPAGGRALDVMAVGADLASARDTHTARCPALSCWWAPSQRHRACCGASEIRIPGVTHERLDGLVPPGYEHIYSGKVRDLSAARSGDGDAGPPGAALGPTGSAFDHVLAPIPDKGRC
jgi:hypothetical protein